MKISKRQIKRIIKEEMSAHPRSDLGSAEQPLNLGQNIAGVNFPIVVGYSLGGSEQSEIAYNQDSLDDILDDLDFEEIPYSLNALEDVEPQDMSVGPGIEQYSENKEKIRKIIFENISLDRYLGGEYKDYEYGDPEKAARNIKESLEDLVDVIEHSMELAGDALGPGLKGAILPTLRSMLAERGIRVR